MYSKTMRRLVADAGNASLTGSVLVSGTCRTTLALTRVHRPSPSRWELIHVVFQRCTLIHMCWLLRGLEMETMPPPDQHIDKMQWDQHREDTDKQGKDRTGLTCTPQEGRLMTNVWEYRWFWIEATNVGWWANGVQPVRDPLWGLSHILNWDNKSVRNRMVLFHSSGSNTHQDSTHGNPVQVQLGLPSKRKPARPASIRWMTGTEFQTGLAQPQTPLGPRWIKRWWPLACSSLIGAAGWLTAAHK